MVNVLIVGSTGMVGKAVLEECIKSKKINKIYLINRRHSLQDNKKVTEFINPNFLEFRTVLKKIPKFDICFYCVGVYQGAVSKTEFIQVTDSYIRAFLKAEQNKKITFCLLSAQGANTKSRILFAKWKGKAEEQVTNAKFNKTYFFRPSYIHPTNQPEKKKLFFYNLLYYFYPFIGWLLPQRYVIELDILARIIVSVGVNGAPQTILENKAMRKMKIIDY